MGPYANDYFQAAFAFIKQIATGGGWKPTAPVDMNGQKLTNLATGTVSSTSKDAVTGAQLLAVYKVGEVKMWHGAVANIAATWGAGWQLADGTNGTADLRDKFIVGAGATYSPNATGGASTVALTTAQMPSHTHTVNDPGHAHGVLITDPGHLHSVSDPGHTHPVNYGEGGGSGGGFNGPIASSPGTLPTQSATTGVLIQRSITGIGATTVLTGTSVTVQNTGNGAAVPTLPPYYAMCFIEYTGAA